MVRITAGEIALAGIFGTLLAAAIGTVLGPWVSDHLKRDEEVRAEAAEQRREARQRGRVAAEHALAVVSALEAAFDYRTCGPEGPPDEHIEPLLANVRQDTLPIPHAALRERVDELLEVIDWRETAAQWGGPDPGRAARAGIYELRETFAEWLRSGGLYVGDTWATKAYKGAHSAIRDAQHEMYPDS